MLHQHQDFITQQQRQVGNFRWLQLSRLVVKASGGSRGWTESWCRNQQQKVIAWQTGPPPLAGEDCPSLLIKLSCLTTHRVMPGLVSPQLISAGRESKKGELVVKHSVTVRLITVTQTLTLWLPGLTSHTEDIIWLRYTKDQDIINFLSIFCCFMSPSFNVYSILRREKPNLFIVLHFFSSLVMPILTVWLSLSY